MKEVNQEIGEAYVEEVAEEEAGFLWLIDWCVCVVVICWNNGLLFKKTLS